MEISRIVYSVVRKWWLVVIFAILSGGVGYYINIFQTRPMYSADSTLYVLHQDNVSAGLFSGFLYSRSVTTAAASELNRYHITPGMLNSMITISSEKGSNILKISAVASNPELATAVVNAVANQFMIKVRSITQNDDLGILDTAQVPEYPIPNNGILKTLIWIFAGSVIALGIIYIIEYFDTTVHSVEEIESKLNLCVIGIIPKHDIR